MVTFIILCGKSVVSYQTEASYFVSFHAIVFLTHSNLWKPTCLWWSIGRMSNLFWSLTTTPPSTPSTWPSTTPAWTTRVEVVASSGRIARWQTPRRAGCWCTRVPWPTYTRGCTWPKEPDTFSCLLSIPSPHNGENMLPFFPYLVLHCSRGFQFMCCCTV